MSYSQKKSSMHGERNQPNNPLHGVTLEMMLHYLVDHIGWEEMGRRIRIRCFNDNPSIGSSLKFLRTTSWARKKVEDLYLEEVEDESRTQNESGV